MEKEKQKINGGTKFFFAMLLIWALVAIFNWNFFLRVFSNFWNILDHVVPILIFVFVVMFLVNIFVEPRHIQKHLGHESGIKGWIYSIIAGILIPSPPYVIFPLLGEFQKNGMKNSLIVSFLYNRNLQITFLPVMALYFGLPFTIIISTYIFLFAIVSGLILEKILKH